MSEKGEKQSVKKQLPTIVAVAVCLSAIIVAWVLHFRENNIGARLARLEPTVRRVDLPPEGAVNMKLYGINKADLDGVHNVMVMEIDATRVAIVTDRAVDDSTSFGLSLPVAGDSSQSGREWAGNFTYSYQNNETRCEYFGIPFRVSHRRNLHIGNETFDLKKQHLILANPSAEVLESRPLEVDLRPAGP